MDFPSTFPGTQVQRAGEYFENQAQAQAETPPVEHHWHDVYSHTVDGYQQAAESETTLFGSDVQNSEHAMEMSSTSMEGVGQAVVEQGHELWNQLKALTHQADDPNQNAKGVLQHIGLALGTLTTIEQGLSALLSSIPFPAFPALHVLNMGVGFPHGHPHPPNLIPPAPPIPLPSAGPIIPIPILSGAANILINGLPAARCGDMGLGIWCGGYFPMYEIFLGSSSVWLEGARAARVGIDITKHCILSSGTKDIPIGVPLGMTVTCSGNVMYGGIPMPSLSAMALKYIFKGIGKLVKPIIRQIPYVGRFILCDVLRLEPVDITSGEVVLDQDDFEMRWPLPLSWKRRYRSGSRRRGHCGIGWETLADARLEFQEDGSVLFFDGQAGGAFFDWLPGDEPVNEPIAGGQLRRAEDKLTVRLKGGRCYHFSEPRSGQTEAIVERITDPCENSLTFVRDENGLRAIVSNLGPQIDVTSRAGCIESMRLQHPLKREPQRLIRYAYDEQGDLSASYDALEKPHTYHYINHGMIRHTDRRGLSFYYEYDQTTVEGRVMHAWGDGGLYESKFTYDALEHKTTLTNSQGHVTVIEFDNHKFPIAETNPLGAVTFYAYDEYGRTTEVIHPGGRQTEYLYDGCGNVEKMTRPDGVAIVTTFDENNNAVSVTDANGNVWRQEWDARGLLVKEISPLEAVTDYEYNLHGQLTAVRDSRGGRTQLNRDAFGNVVSIIDALGRETTYEVDALGNTLLQIDVLGNKTLYEYDQKGRLISKKLPSGHTTEYGYDGEDNLITHRDGEGHLTQFEYCGLGEIARQIQADGQIVSYLYDTEERLIKVTNQRGQTYHMCRDSAGRVIKELDYWGQATKYDYDPSGNLQRSEDALGRVIEYQTDLLGRLQRSQLPDGTTEEFIYDPNGNLVATVNQHIKVQRKFDAEGRVLEELQGDFVIRNRYDSEGNRISRETSTGNSVKYEYDVMSQIKTICINDSNPIQIDYDALGQAVKERLSPELARTCRYNADGLLKTEVVESAGEEVLRREYNYDRRGELVRLNDSRRGSDVFVYDPMSRIKEHINPDGKIHKYFFDPVGDLLRPISTNIGQPGAWQRTEQYNGLAYHFDAAGNLIEKNYQDHSLKLKWDANDRLESSLNWDGSETKYGYDAQGRRVFKETNAIRTNFYWDADALLADASDSDNQREFVYYPDSFVPLASIDAKQQVFFYHTGSAGITHGMSDERGASIWSGWHSVLGTLESSDSNHVNPLRLQGQYFDEETGLSYNRYRYFDPELGSFITKDPIGLLGGENPYWFAPNIWSWADPLGLKCWVQRRVESLLQAIPKNSRGRITMAAGVARDPKTGRTVRLIATSETRGYLRPGVNLRHREVLVAGTGHAEADIVSYASRNGLELLEVGATRPVCKNCASRIGRADAATVTPPKVYK